MTTDRTRLRATALPLLGSVLLLAACAKPPEPAPRGEAARAVSVAQVEMRRISGRNEATGLLVPREEIAVGAELSGYRVAEVRVEEGALVDEGEVLVRLDDTLLRARLEQARANFELAESEARRVDGLDGSGVLSDEEIAQRRIQARVAKAQLDDLSAQLARLQVRAPAAGLVLERTIRPGAVSGGGEAMFRIARDSLIELDAEVPEDQIARIEPDSTVRVQLPGGPAFEGQVRLISPRIDPQTKLGRVRVRLPVDPALRAGGFASALFQRETQPVPVVPERAIQFEARGPLLTVIDAEKRAQRVSIRTGARADGMVELLEGPPAGSWVALGGGAFLLDGDLVDPQPVAADSAEAQPMQAEPARAEPTRAEREQAEPVEAAAIDTLPAAQSAAPEQGR